MLKGKTDSAASSMQPQSEKSTSQKMGDAFSSNSNENQVRDAVLRGFSCMSVCSCDAMIVDCLALARSEGEERHGHG